MDFLISVPPPTTQEASIAMHLHRYLLQVCLVLVHGLNVVNATDIMFKLDYSTLNVLPSATGQGLQFVSGSYLGVTESDVFQVATGALKLTTPSGYSLTRGGIYNLANGYDSTLDLEYRFTAKVVSGGSDALQFGFGDANYYGSVGISPTRFAFPGYGNNVDLGVDPTQFHDYLITSKANSGEFAFWIDGTQAFSGNLKSVSSGTSYAYFGQPYNYNSSNWVTAEFKSIDYSNRVNSVPEASTLIPLLGCWVLVWTKNCYATRKSPNS